MPVNTGFKGLLCHQTGNELLFTVGQQDAAGALVTGGTTSLYVYELQSDGTIKSYDWNDNTFKTTTLTTETVSMVHQTGNNGATNTGYWTYALATLTGFTTGAIYTVLTLNTGAAPQYQWYEFQYGSAEGDEVTTVVSTGVAYLQVDMKDVAGGPVISGVLPLALAGFSGGIALNAISGVVNANASVSIASGALSGQFVNIFSGTLVNVFSGQLSGQPVFILSGQLSGQRLDLTSGVSWIASGQSTLLYSGAISGQLISVFSGSLSGQPVSILSGQLSGQTLDLTSGVSWLGSGQFMNVYSGQLSGQQLTARTINDKSGYVLAGNGIDLIYPESGINARQSLSINSAVLAGQLSGAGTNNITIDGANTAGTRRVTATCNNSGDRTTVTLNLPT